MSKAEKRACQYTGYCKNQSYSDFLKGYHQAEKDLELTWEDIGKIISINQHVCGVMGISNYIDNHQQAMEEVLKRFRERKEK